MFLSETRAFVRLDEEGEKKVGMDEGICDVLFWCDFLFFFFVYYLFITFIIFIYYFVFFSLPRVLDWIYVNHKPFAPPHLNSVLSDEIINFKKKF
jgi:hypothetical protein